MEALKDEAIGGQFSIPGHDTQTTENSFFRRKNEEGKNWGGKEGGKDLFSLHGKKETKEAEGKSGKSVSISQVQKGARE